MARLAFAHPFFLHAILATLLAACSTQPTPQAGPAAGLAGKLPGYLASSALPNSLALVPPVPEVDSPALLLDQAISRQSLLLRDSARWALAAADADLSLPHAAGTFSCALNAPIDASATPVLYRLLRRTMVDLGGTTAAAKKHYQRPRPFLWNQQPICTPQQLPNLAKDGSYPSGHSAAGWGWALILAELSPEHSDAIMQRGLSYGESRKICNVHWHSDVVQARNVAAVTVARLHAEPAFIADLAAAKAELIKVRSQGLPPTRDCAAEAAALATPPSLAP